jgi:hypothetical protein
VRSVRTNKSFRAFDRCPSHPPPWGAPWSEAVEAWACRTYRGEEAVFRRGSAPEKRHQDRPDHWLRPCLDGRPGPISPNRRPHQPRHPEVPDLHGQAVWSNRPGLANCLNRYVALRSEDPPQASGYSALGTRCPGSPDAVSSTCGVTRTGRDQPDLGRICPINPTVLRQARQCSYVPQVDMLQVDPVESQMHRTAIGGIC